MPQFARIKLTSTNLSNLEQICKEIRDITEKTGVKTRGPHPLPTKKRKVVTRKAPSGQGTSTFDRWEMRIHRRLIDIDADDRTMRQLMRLRIPEDVYIEVSLSTR
ncbi:MAG: 30S ribosomal protein S10 [Candidatus Methylarchaceae archaeon HK01B]|nr:30S ribosomal protein S10 [Candidatus Methylarchaceae archaeon HK01M]MCP8312126.1 30S ribosomal protein S10 [Candidatus Methylarchaceae archaeon HK02M1]MCP8318977.1 30S ribosomal protein S10 [Candidatus Methylarchaceae archaeon HK01B]